jgi:hypothetical protein
LPDTPLSPSFPIAGFFPGFGAALTSAPQVAKIDLSTVSLAIFAINATKIANDTADSGLTDAGAEQPCANFIGAAGAGGGSLTLNTDYWNIGTIPAQTLKHGETWVVAVTGCFPGEDNNEADFCPTSPPYSAATGNLGIKAWQVDNTTVVDAGGIGAQFASASPSWDTLGAQAGGTTTAAGFWIETPAVIPDSGVAETGASDGGDAATADGGASDAATDATTDGGSPQPTLTFIPITSTGTYGTLSPAALATVPVPLNSPAAGFFTSFASATGAIQFPPGCTPGVSCASPLLLPLPVIDQLTNGTVPTGGSFVNGKGYAFILVGDPLDPTYIGADGGAATSTTGVFNGKSIHFLGLPTSNP